MTTHKHKLQHVVSAPEALYSTDAKDIAQIELNCLLTMFACVFYVLRHNIVGTELKLLSQLQCNAVRCC